MSDSLKDQLLGLGFKPAPKPERTERKPDAKPQFRARVALIGSEIDDPSLTKLIESCGALIVSDRFCFGSVPGREVIELNDTETLGQEFYRWEFATAVAGAVMGLNPFDQPDVEAAVREILTRQAAAA